MYFLGVIVTLVVVGGCLGYILKKRTAATESSGSYRSSGFTRE
jgi:hypothetical protein